MREVTSEDAWLLGELYSIFDDLVLPGRKSGDRELEEAARRSFDVVARWMLARETARVLAAIEKPLNQRTS